MIGKQARELILLFVLDWGYWSSDTPPVLFGRFAVVGAFLRMGYVDDFDYLSAFAFVADYPYVLGACFTVWFAKSPLHPIDG